MTGARGLSVMRRHGHKPVAERRKNMGLAIVIAFELALTVFVIWGILHEDRLIRFEHRVYAKIKERIKSK